MHSFFYRRAQVKFIFTYLFRIAVVNKLLRVSFSLLKCKLNSSKSSVDKYIKGKIYIIINTYKLNNDLRNYYLITACLFFFTDFDLSF